MLNEHCSNENQSDETILIVKFNFVTSNIFKSTDDILY